jgi:hypothetical protein
MATELSLNQNKSVKIYCFLSLNKVTSISIRAFQCSLLNFINIIFVFTIFFVIGLCLPIISEYDAFAHIPISNTSRIQEWTDPSSGISTLFVYEPEKPIIDTFTELKFSIQNTTTGNHISDADNARARVVVTNGQRLFKFENITVGDDGHFSVKYLFPDDGTHQVITRLDINDSSTASSFNVFVPHQATPGIVNPFPSTPQPTTTDSDNSQQISNTVILIGVISGIAGTTIFLLRRK